MNKLIVDLLEQLLSAVPSSYHEKLQAAVDFAVRAHTGQTRKTGEPYVVHPLRAALELVKLRGSEADLELIIATILHDTVEDTPVTLEEIEEHFGSTVRKLVEGVTNYPKPSRPYDHFEYERKNIERVSEYAKEDPRVALLKLVDRLDNIRTVDAFLPEKRRRYLQETEALILPLAQQFGEAEIASELARLIKEKKQTLPPPE